MDISQIHPGDIRRILIGDAPPVFLLEIFIRTIIIYLGLLITVRWLGKRMAGQLSVVELCVMLTLGAIVSGPMQQPDRGILIGLFILVCTVIFQRGINWLSFKNEKVERAVQGQMCLLVKDGVLQLDEMSRSRVSHQQLYAMLRTQQVLNLGEVERTYLEANGDFSIYKREKVLPGLSVIPGADQAFYNEQETRYGLKACTNCGRTEAVPGSASCPNCGSDQWVAAKC